MTGPSHAIVPPAARPAPPAQPGAGAPADRRAHAPAMAERLRHPRPRRVGAARPARLGVLHDAAARARLPRRAPGPPVVGSGRAPARRDRLADDAACRSPTRRGSASACCHRLGSIRAWLEVHIFCGLVGPVLVTFHTSFKFNGLISVAYWSMVVVAVSGVIGRYSVHAHPEDDSRRGADLRARCARGGRALAASLDATAAARERRHRGVRSRALAGESACRAASASGGCAGS